MLTSQDIHNLLIFLSRVQLTGSEAITFVQLVEKIRQIEAQKEGDF